VKRIHTIDLKHFKAFQDGPPIDLGGRNLLLYGPNGSGKSSIFWALYTFLQSSQKPLPEVQKYFDPTHKESLANIDMAEAASSSIVLHIGEETDAASAEPVRIALDAHETPKPDWQKANRASDFVTYRVLFRFYHFTNSEEIDLWPVFLREILPFCHGRLSRNLADAWADIYQEDPYLEAKHQNARGRAAAKIYDELERRLGDFQVGLETSLDSIKKAAQKFHNQHFAIDGEKPLTIALRLTQPPSYDRKKHVLTVPKIGLGITLGGKPILRPQSFSNESKLTQIALSVRFGATKANLQDAPLKLLVLDDLLISLDMSNRMQVIKIILSDEDFADYQKIIMTHDRGFYNEIRRNIGSDHGQWEFKRLHCPNGGAPQHMTDKDDLQLAVQYLTQNRLEEAAVALRKAAEANLKRFSEQKLGMVFEGGKFRSLSDNLKNARQRIEKDSNKKIRQFLKAEAIDEATVAQLILVDDAAMTAREALDEPSRGKLIHAGRLLCSLLQEILKVNEDALHILQKIEETKDRILNPGSHAGDPVLYSAEVESALALIRSLSALADESEEE
jgi:hypothetical protein